MLPKSVLSLSFFHQTLTWLVSLYHHVFIYRRAGPSKIVVLDPTLYQPIVRALYIEFCMYTNVYSYGQFFTRSVLLVPSSATKSNRAVSVYLVNN